MRSQASACGPLRSNDTLAQLFPLPRRNGARITWPPPRNNRSGGRRQGRAGADRRFGKPASPPGSGGGSDSPQADWPVRACRL